MHKIVSGEYEMKGDAPELLQSRHGTGEISVAPLIIYGLPSQEQSKTAALQLYWANKEFDTTKHLHKKKTAERIPYQGRLLFINWVSTHSICLR